MSKNPKHIHVILKDKRLQKFTELKEKLELNSDVDVMRTCLDIAHKQNTEGNVVIRPELLKIAEQISKIPYLQKKHLIFSLNDIINESLSNWIHSHYADFNLHSFSFRKELPEIDQQVALTFIEHQNDYDRGLTLHQIKKICSDLDEKDIEKSIRNFLDNNLISSIKIRDETYYFAPIS